MGIEYASTNPIQVRICVYILRELNMRHTIQISRTYPMGIEHASAIEEVDIEIETKVNPRQEPHQNR